MPKFWANKYTLNEEFRKQVKTYHMLSKFTFPFLVTTCEVGPSRITSKIFRDVSLQTNTVELRLYEPIADIYKLVRT